MCEAHRAGQVTSLKETETVFRDMTRNYLELWTHLRYERVASRIRAGQFASIQQLYGERNGATLPRDFTR